jgi:hypothetical protein
VSAVAGDALRLARDEVTAAWSFSALKMTTAKKTPVAWLPFMSSKSQASGA